MTLVKFEPYRGFEKLGRRMGRFMEEFDRNALKFDSNDFLPRVDITENETNLFVHAELPGMKKEDIKISVNEDRMLTIKGEKKNEHREEDKNYVRTERAYGSFSRSFILPETIDIESVNAKFENGVLELTLTKKEPEQPKEIEISIS